MIFEKDYYSTDNVSTYSNYFNRKYSDLAKELIKELNLTPSNSILDFGCATGGLVQECIKQGIHNVKGTDISFWAVEYGREHYNLSPDILHHYNRNLLDMSFDTVFFLDVLEHIPTTELFHILDLCKSKKIVVRIPVSLKEGETFFLEVSRNDKTHIQIHDKNWWEENLLNSGFKLDKILNGRFIYDSPGVLARVYANIA